MPVSAELGKQLLERSQRDPVWWIETFLGYKLWPKQVEIAEAVRDFPRVAVRSCHASGKTFLTASLALWFAYSFPDSMTITTAPGDRQVKHNMWGEIGRAYERAKVPLSGRFYPKSARLELGMRWGIIGFATDKPTRFSGYHREHMLVIIDEASGIDESVFESIEGLRSAGKMIRVIMLSQMTTTTGTFYNSFFRNRSQWKTFTISAFDTPNFESNQIRAWKDAGSPVEGFDWSHPYLVNPVWVYDLEKSAGKESDLYRVRVLGIEPKGEAAAVIPLHMAEAATKRVLMAPKDGGTWMGLDIARGGDDDCYVYIRRGPVVLYCEAFSPTGTNPTEETAGWALDLAIRFGVSDINVDDIGVGAGVYDMLLANAPARGVRVHPINFGSQPRDTEHFANRRAEDYMGLRQRFEKAEISLINIAEDPAGPTDIDRLLPELTGLRWKPATPAGKAVLEDKHDYKKRLGRSPDAADALCLAFALPYDEIAIFSMYDEDPRNFGSDTVPAEPEEFFQMGLD